MDHIPLPAGTWLTADDRTLYIAEAYDDGAFLTYPQRSRFAKLYNLFLVDGVLAPSPLPSGCHDLLADLEAFVQTWCFFGLLREVFGQSAPTHRFTCVVADETFLSTVHLLDIVEDWAAATLDAGEELATKRSHHLACTNRVYDLLFGIQCRDIDIKPQNLQPIVMLAEALEKVIHFHLPGKEFGYAPWSQFCDWFGYVDRMLQNGWEQQTIKLLGSSLSRGAAFGFYMSKLPLFHHKQQRIGTNLLKTLATIPQLTPTHRNPCLKCQTRTIDVRLLHQILEDGKIAVLDLTEFDIDASGHIDIKGIEPHDSYLAISHVWSEGMGNSLANALPGCQLQYVAEMATQVWYKDKQMPPVLIWLDTLCCPALSLPHKNLCLERMQSIYQNAGHVLVMSTMLTGCDATSLDAFELGARLVSSPWMTRLWTYQEAVLAKVIWICLSDEPILLSEVRTSIAALCDANVLHRVLTVPLLGSLRTLNSKALSAADDPAGRSTLNVLCRGLVSRTVTFAADEPLCLATCCGLPQKDLLKVAHEDRMATFWRTFAASHKQIPLRVVAFDGPRVTTRGYGWAPASLLQQYRPLSSRNIVLADLTANGLAFSSPGFRIEYTLPDLAVDRGSAERYLSSWWDNIRLRMPQASHLHRHGTPPTYIRHRKLGWLAVVTQGSADNGPQIGRLPDPMTSRISRCCVLQDKALLSELQSFTNSASIFFGEVVATTGGRIHMRTMHNGSISLLDADDNALHEAGWTALKRLIDSTALPERSLDRSQYSSEPPWPTKLQETSREIYGMLKDQGRLHSQADIFANAYRHMLQGPVEIVDEYSAEQQWLLS